MKIAQVLKDYWSLDDKRLRNNVTGQLEQGPLTRGDWWIAGFTGIYSAVRVVPQKGASAPPDSFEKK